MNLSDWIVLLGSIGSVSAVVVAWFAIKQSNKQLKIEQTPYVVLDHIRIISPRVGFAIKNIGKGPAMSITFNISGDLEDRNDAFFSNDQPHSANLSSSEESHYWEVDLHVIQNLYNHGNDFAYIFIIYQNQLGAFLRTNVKVQKIVKSGGRIEFIVMENQVEEI